MTMFCEVCMDEKATLYNDDGDIICSRCGCVVQGVALGIHVVEDREPIEIDYEYPQFFSDEEPRQ